jgi:hypothetical protein
MGARAITSLILVVPLLAAACGAATSSQGVDDAFRTRALAACQDALQAKHAWASFPAGSFDPAKPDPAKLAQVGTWLDGAVQPVFDGWSAGMSGLGEPASGGPAWGALVKLVQETAQLNADQAAAAKAGDAAGFAAATAKLRASHAALQAAAKTAGVDACGDVVS